MRSLTLDRRTDGELGVRPSRRLLGPRESLRPETKVATWVTCAVEDCASPLSRACSSSRRPRVAAAVAAPVSWASVIDVVDDDDGTELTSSVYNKLTKNTSNKQRKSVFLIRIGQGMTLQQRKEEKEKIYWAKSKKTEILDNDKVKSEIKKQ